MEAKEKAKELMDKIESVLLGCFVPISGEPYFPETKRCALIAAKEMISEYENQICGVGYDYDWEMWEERKQYWIEVKQEIEKL